MTAIQSKSTSSLAWCVVVLACAALPAFAQVPKITDLPGTYASATDDSEGEWTEYDFTLASDGQTHPYRVRYQFGQVTSRSAPVITTRTLLVNGAPQAKGHVIENNFKRDSSEIKNLHDQLLKNKEYETWKSLVVKKLEVTGAEDVVIGSNKLACLKIEFEYSGTVGDALVPVEAKEILYYCDKVAVTKMAKFVGNYELSTINGVKKQTIELTMLKSGKEPPK